MGIHLLVHPFNNPVRGVGTIIISVLWLRKPRVGREESSVLTISVVRRVGDTVMALICTYFYYCDREEKELSLKSCPKYSTCYLCDIKWFSKLVHDNIEKSLNCRSLYVPVTCNHAQREM